MFLTNDWEMFYTESKKDDELVDQISIDSVNKRYILDLNANSLVTDGCDKAGNEINSIYVSRFVFDLICEGVKNKEFKKVRRSK